MLLRKIVLFAAVDLHIIELPRVQFGGTAGVAIANEFPLAVSNGTIEVVVKIRRVLTFQLTTAKGWQETDSLEWLNIVAAKFARMLDTSCIKTGRHQVDEMPGLALDATVVLWINPLGPRHDQR